MTLRRYREALRVSTPYMVLVRSPREQNGITAMCIEHHTHGLKMIRVAATTHPATMVQNATRRNRANE